VKRKRVQPQGGRLLQGKAAASAMEGRTIVRADLHEWDDSAVAPEGLAQTCHTLVLHLDNGAQVQFEVQESELGKFGVTPEYYPKS